MHPKVWVLGGAVFVGLVLQTALVPFLQVAQVRPDLLLALAVAVGLAFGPREAVGVGLAAGLLEDLLVGRHLGLFAAAKVLAGFVVALTGQKVYKDHLLVPLCGGLVGTWVARLVVVFLLNVSGVASSWDVAAGQTLIEAGANGVLSGLLFGPVARLERAFGRAAGGAVETRAAGWF